MSDTPIQDALSNLGTTGEGLDLTVAASDNNKPIVGFNATKNLGKGWSVSGAVEWTQKQWAALGKLTWRPK